MPMVEPITAAAIAAIEADGEADAGSPDEAREHVAAELVGAEECARR